MITKEIDTQKIEILKKISLFKELRDDADSMQLLAGLFSTTICNAGDYVIKEGQVGDALYIIKSGKVDVIKKTRPGDPYSVAELSADMNIFFGELALLDQEKRSATVVCKTDCEFYLLNRDDFHSLGNRHSSIGLLITRELSKIVCQRLRKANTDIITLFDALVEEVSESGGLLDSN